MKRYLAAVLLILPVIVSGCMGEDWSLCRPGENCLLRYRYHDEDGADAFTDKIGTVDLLVFGANDEFVAMYHSSANDLARFRGTSMTLEPGDYKVVAWANVSSADATVTTLTDSTLDIAEGGDGLPVYYAPYVRPITRVGGRGDSDMSLYSITVPDKGTVERDLDFTRAHRSINVFIKGYEDPVQGPDPQMQVEVSHLAYAYDFMLRVEPGRRDHKSMTRIKNTPLGNIPGVTLNTPYQEIEDEIEITIHTTDGRRVCPPVNLREFLVGQGASLDPLALHEITILVEFTNGQVSISLAGWNDNTVDPV